MKGATSALVVITFIGVVAAQFSDFNCDLRTGIGCSASNRFFDSTYQGSTSGSSFECRRNYRLRVTLTSPFNGFFCYFLTRNPQQGRFTYTVSHNAFDFDDERSAWIRTRGANTRIEPEVGFSEPYNDNFWSYRNFHSPSGESWGYYEFSRDKLSYFSENLEHSSTTGHRSLFEPASRTTYIGLNRKYESSQGRGKGLCQVYCAVFADFGSSPLGAAKRSAAQRRASDPSSGVAPEVEIRPAGPPAVLQSEPTSDPPTPSPTPGSTQRRFTRRRFF